MSGSNRKQGARGDVVTFYSFKGGVGRSMALANVAAIYAHRGRRVLALDFDFEAPGLHRYFLKRDRYTPTEPRHGVLDLFATLRDRLHAMFPAGRGIQDEGAPRKLRALVAEQIDTGDYLYKVQLTDPNTRPPRDLTIDFIAAARFDAAYSELVRTFDWQGLYEDHAEVFPAFVNELGSRYDIILVDSRTGVTDIGSICTMVLPDKLVLVFTPNEQSLAGALDAGWQAVQGRRSGPEPRRLGIFPLVSRVEESEEQQKRAWIRRVRESFEKLASEAYGAPACDLEAYFNVVRVPHRGYYAYGEQIAAEEQAVSETGSLAQVYDRFANSLEHAGVLEAQSAMAPAAAERTDDPQEVFLKLFEANRLATERPSEAIRAYDDLVPRLIALHEQGMPGSAPILLELLTHKARLLDDLHRFDESVEVGRDIVRRLGSIEDPQARIIVDRATYNLGNALSHLDRHDEALSIYDQLIERFERNTSKHAEQGLARALFAKGTVLGDSGRATDAVATYDVLLERFRDSTDPVIHTQVLKAMTNKAAELVKLGDDAGALAVRDDIVQRFGESSDAEHREAVGIAWIGKIVTLAKQARHEEAIEECNKLLDRFSGDQEPDVLKSVAMAMFFKSASLEGLGRREESDKILDNIIDRFGNARSSEYADPLASALFFKSARLLEEGKTDEAQEVRAELVRRFRHGPAGQAQNLAAGALIQSAGDLESSGRYREALAAVDEYLSLFSNNPDPVVRSNYYASLIGRGSLLARLGRCQAAVVAADHAYERIVAARDADSKALLPAVLSHIGFARLCLAKQTWLGSDEPAARALLEEAASKIADARALAPEQPSMMGDAAYAAFLLGREEEARALLTRALALGGSTIREAALRDADICSLPQDDAFRALVRSIPDAVA